LIRAAGQPARETSLPIGENSGVQVRPSGGCLFRAGLSEEEAQEKPFIASMGIYVFKKDLMLKLLREQAKSNDFGGEIIPKAAANSRVMAYLFNDYWEDIGTIKSFFEANLGLAQQVRLSPPCLKDMGRAHPSAPCWLVWWRPDA
jgi:NDP-sugar pyrophosphorylase family protein